MTYYYTRPTEVFVEESSQTAFSWATVAGCGITTAADYALHTNCVIAPNTPSAATTGLPLGAFAFKPFGTLISTYNVLVLM